MIFIIIAVVMFRYERSKNMPIKLKPKCTVCDMDKIFFEEDVVEVKNCYICGIEFEADSTCDNTHYVCHMCRQKDAREAIISHCLQSDEKQPYPLMLELMELPEIAIHGPEHHLLLTAALLTAYFNENDSSSDLPDMLDEANQRSMHVPGGACGAWGICGAAIGSGIYMSIITESQPLAAEEWQITGQLTARCANAVSHEGGPRCCKRDSFLSIIETIEYSNDILNTRFDAPDHITCEFYPNNKECKLKDCPFFPTRSKAN